MARQTTRARERGAVSPPAARKDTRQSWKSFKTVLTQLPVSPNTRPSRSADAPKVIEKSKPKSKQTVSAASIFQKASKSRSSRDNPKRHQHRSEATPEPALLAGLKDGFAEARAAMGNKTQATFDDIHAELTQRLDAGRAADGQFLDAVVASAGMLTAPLADEQIRVELCKDGKRVVAVHHLGDRVSAFKETVEKEEATLKELWKQWNDVQDEYLELGVEVFGREPFGRGGGSEKGYKKEMDLLDAEHDARVGEVEKEIDDIGPDILKKTKASEKELNLIAKAEQAKLLQTMLF